MKERCKNYYHVNCCIIKIISYINSELQVVNNSDVNIEIDVHDVGNEFSKRRAVKTLKKSRAGYVSYLTKTINTILDFMESIENFKTRIHEKALFTDSIRMERLISVLEGDTKKSKCSIENNRLFYATSLKILERQFGNPLVATNIKMSALLDQPQISGNDKVSPRSFHHQLKYTNTWLSKMGYTSCIQSSEYLTKAVMILSN